MSQEYTITELKTILGDNYLDTLSNNLNIEEPLKPLIYAYQDLDDSTKNVFDLLYTLIKSLNPDSQFILCIKGGRVIGKWRTQSEADFLNSEYGVNFSVTPYEYWSTAENLPTSDQLLNISPNVPIELNYSNESPMIIIPPPTL